MRVKYELENKQSNNKAQSGYVPSGIAICRDGDFWTRFAPRHLPCDSGETAARGENEGCFIAVKFTTIILRSRHLVLRSLGNLLVCESPW